MDISFVILHYNAIEDTVKCIKSIQKLKHEPQERISIVIVDNSSPNETGMILKGIYEGSEDIDVLLLEQNVGFACGNNAGYIYAKEKYNPDFIILSNNDIIIEQDDFIAKINELYQANHFSVLGPSIYAPYKGVYQNPLREKEYTIQELKSLIENYQKKIRIFKILEKTHSYFFLHLIKQILRRNTMKRSDNLDERFQVVLHGAFLIMSRDYINIFPHGLCDKTFMYMEEDILFYLCQERGLKMMYSPRIRVIHNEGASTRNALKSRARKSIFEFENTIQSAYVLLDILNSDNK
ncbi:MAG: glycosyltransferase [Lachnospiraceae bacterium]|nr:glycosyltransferase [Lachnospiraceae bacterium]